MLHDDETHVNGEVGDALVDVNQGGGGAPTWINSFVGM